MMTQLKRVAFWILLTLSVAATVWWILYVPYRPERLFAAIPANATVVSVNQNLAGEWDSLRNNPLLRDVVCAAGMTEEDLSKITTNETVREWVTRLASDRTVLAYAPSLGAQAKPGLVAASWIGGQSRRLRWQMAWIKSRDFQPVVLDGGRQTIWLTRVKIGNTNLNLSLALSEGMVLGCLSEDPTGVRVLLEAAESYPNRMTLAMTGRPAQARTMMPGMHRNWGWFSLGDDVAAYDFSLTDSHLEINMAGALHLPPAPKLNDRPGMKKATGLLGATSDLVAILPLSWVNTFTRGDSSCLWLNALRQLADTNGTPDHALAFIALLDQNHNTRLRGPFGATLRALIKGVKTPTLLIGVQVGNKDEAGSRINRILAQLNSQYNMGLVARRAEAGDSVTLIEESGKNFYSSFEPGERIAYAMLDDWLLLASNASGLEKVMHASCEGLPAWGTPAQAEPSGIIWVNLDNIGRTVKTTANVLKLASLLNTTPGMVRARDTLAQTETIAQVLHAFSQAHATASVSGGVFRATLVLGKP